MNRNASATMATMNNDNSNRKRNNSTENGSIPLLDESDSDLLFCQQERLDQNSPELWPETMPGVSEFTSSALFSSPPKPLLNTTLTQAKNESLQKEDLEMIHELGTLTLIQLMEKFHTLKNQAYQLGLEETKEMTRGRYLNVLGKKK